MNRCSRLLVLAAVVLAWWRPVAAADVYATGFEDPPFAPGSQLSGQDGWFAPTIDDPSGFPFDLNPAAGLVTTANPLDGAQSFQVLGSDLQADDGILDVTGGYYHAIGSYRHAVGYDAGPNGAVRVQVDVFVAGATTPGNNFFSAGVGARGTDFALGEMAISSDGMVHAYTGDDNVPTFLLDAPITLGTWHSLAIVADFGAQTSFFYVDGAPLGSIAFVAPTPNNVLLRGSLLAYAGPDTASLHRADFGAYYDNFSIRAVPEPGGLVLLGSGALGLVALRTLRRRATP